MRPRKVSDEAILDEALAALAASGGRASSEVIAARLGVSQAALFKRFGSMDALVARALGRLVAGRDWRAAFRKAPDPARLTLQLRDIARTMMEYAHCSLTAVEVMRGRVAYDKVDELLAGVGLPSLAVITQDFVGWLERAAEAGAAIGPPQPLADAFLGGLHNRFVLHHMQSPDWRTPDAIDADALIALLFPAPAHQNVRVARKPKL